MAPRVTGILGCDIIPTRGTQDRRGSLSELYRASWPGAFAIVQWNVCSSSSGVVRGAHVHADYDEFYTLPRGQVSVGLTDIRRASPTFGRSVQIAWRDRDEIALVVPSGVAHVVLFQADSVLVFGLSRYWSAQDDELGCQWDDPQLGFVWPVGEVLRSDRDANAGDYRAMLSSFEAGSGRA